MKKQIIILTITVLLIVVGLSGCFGSDNENIKELNKFVGTWEHGSLQDGPIIIFYSNGTCIYIRDHAEWQIKNGKLVIDLLYRERILTLDYEFLDDNQILILTDDMGQIDDYKKI